VTETITIGLLCTVVGAIIGYMSFVRNKAKDDRNEGQQSGQMLTELGYIKSGIDDIKTEQREQRQINTQTATELAAVKASAKQAHLRIDRIEGREYPGHEH
jgi:ABC-type transport system involved in cytochrome bd biosynthesis fused ATPase/permease subunit